MLNCVYNFVLFIFLPLITPIIGGTSYGRNKTYFQLPGLQHRGENSIFGLILTFMCLPSFGEILNKKFDLPVPADSKNLANLGSLGICSDKFVRSTAKLNPIAFEGSTYLPVNSPKSILPSGLVSQHPIRNSTSSAE